MRVVWSSQAVEELHGITAFIQQSTPASARRIAQQIRAATRRLARFPRIGRFVPELEGLDYRELIVQDYRVIYRSGEQQVFIATVVHSSRDLPALRLFRG